MNFFDPSRRSKLRHKLRSQEAALVGIPDLGHSSFGGMVMSNDIAERIKQIVVLHLGVPETNVSDTSSLIDEQIA
jgi:hypothetical protein